MRINKLKKIAEENDYELTDHHVCGELILSRREEKYGDVINTITISKITKGYIAINNMFCDSMDLKMFKASIEFAETSIEDREEEKKFYLEHRYFKCTNGDSRYFQIYGPDGKPWLNAMYSVMGYKKQFTLKEIEEIKKKFDTDLKDFELVEVVDVD